MRRALLAAAAALALLALALLGFALAEAADATDTDAALYQAKLGDMSGEEDVVIVETTAGVSVLSPGPAPSETKNTPITKQKADAAALDALIDANPDTDAAVLALYASAFDGLAPVTEAEQLTVGGFDVTCYRVTENAAETFGGYVNLFEKEKIDYRVNIPEGSEFDEFQIWLLDEAAK